MRRKFEPTRKKKALRTCGVLLTMLVLLHLTRGWFCLTPGMARRVAEAENGLEGMHEIWRDWDDWNWGYFFDSHCCRLTLTENDGMVALLNSHPTVLGWSRGCSVLDCTGPGPVWYQDFNQYDDGRRRILAFGRIDDPAAARLELKITPMTRNSAGDPVPYEEIAPQVFSMDSGEWLEADGRRYFIFRQEYTESDWDRYLWMDREITVYDEAGTVIFQQ